MKRFFLLSAILLISCYFVQAQRLYISLGSGFGVRTYSTFSAERFDGSSKIYSMKKTGVGTGIPVTFGFGFRINPYFGCELGISEFLGLWSGYVSNSSSYQIDSKFNGKMLSIIPAVFITSGLEKVNPYGKIGLILGVFNSITNKYYINYTDEWEEYYYLDRLYGGLAVGVQVVVGTDFKIAKSLSLFTEIRMNSISYSPKHGKTVEYTVNGSDQLSSLTVNDSRWDYYNTVDYDEEIPEDQPDKVLKMNSSFSNVGILLGLKFHF